MSGTNYTRLALERFRPKAASGAAEREIATLAIAIPTKMSTHGLGFPGKGLP